MIYIMYVYIFIYLNIREGSLSIVKCSHDVSSFLVRGVLLVRGVILRYNLLTFTSSI